MDLDRQADIAALDSTLTTVERVLDVDGLRARIAKLEDEASDPKLWDDQANAQKVTSSLSHAQGELRRVEELRGRIEDLPVLYELAEEPATPAKVVITQYVDVAHAFFGGKEPGFVNGLLDRLARDLRPEELD